MNPAETPASTLVRNKLAEQLETYMQTSAGAWFTTRIRQKQETDADLNECPVVFFRRVRLTEVQRSMKRLERTVDMEVTLHGYVDSTSPREDQEKLEYDCARAIAADPNLGGFGRLMTYESGEFFEEWDTTDESVEQRQAAFRTVATIRYIETLG